MRRDLAGEHPLMNVRPVPAQAGQRVGGGVATGQGDIVFLCVTLMPRTPMPQQIRRPRIQPHHRLRLQQPAVVRLVDDGTRYIAV
jgi:hypothetical protein